MLSHPDVNAIPGMPGGVMLVALAANAVRSKPAGNVMLTRSRGLSCTVGVSPTVHTAVAPPTSVLPSTVTLVTAAALYNGPCPRAGGIGCTAAAGPVSAGPRASGRLMRPKA